MLIDLIFLAQVSTDESPKRLYPIHPGYILEDFNIDYSVLKSLLSCSDSEAKGIANGIYPLTKLQAFILDKFTNMSCGYWYSLQLDYEKRIIDFRQWQRETENE